MTQSSRSQFGEHEAVFSTSKHLSRLGSMSNMSRKTLRMVLGIAASFAVFFLLDFFPWETDISHFGVNQQYFLLAVTAAVVVFLAAFAGAFVARKNFIGPAVLLGILGWTAVISFLEAASSAYSPDNFFPYAVVNVGGLAITIGGSISGAMFGSRFSNQDSGNGSSSA